MSASSDSARPTLATQEGDAPSIPTATNARRRLLQAGGLAAAGAVGVLGAAAAPTAVARDAERVADAGRKPASPRAQPTLDAASVVPRATLDRLAAEQHAVFNEGRVLPPFDPARHAARHDVELHRLSTWTTVPETGERVKVSGLLALPVGARGPLPVVSWQHGTILSFDQVPSGLSRLGEPGFVLRPEHHSIETLFNLHRLAGNGYAVVAADYLGKGPWRNGRSEAYGVKAATVQTCTDVLDAGLQALRARGVQPGPLMLNGWSQGGLNTQWLHQALRRQGRAIVATAAQSPFNDISESLRFWTGAERYPDVEGQTYPKLADWVSLCLVVALGSYERHYGLDGLLRSAIRPEFQPLALKFWQDYRLDFDPTSPFPTGPTLLVPGFFERFTHPLNSRFLRHVADNRATYWAYDSPIRLYHGLADEALHPLMATRPLAPGGALATGVPVPRASHRATFLASLYGDAQTLSGQSTVLDWFEERRRA